MGTSSENDFFEFFRRSNRCFVTATKSSIYRVNQITTTGKLFDLQTVVRYGTYVAHARCQHLAGPMASVAAFPPTHRYQKLSRNGWLKIHHVRGPAGRASLKPRVSGPPPCVHHARTTPGMQAGPAAGAGAGAAGPSARARGYYVSYIHIARSRDIGEIEAWGSKILRSQNVLGQCRQIAAGPSDSEPPPPPPTPHTHWYQKLSQNG